MLKIILPLFLISWFALPSFAQDHPHTVLWKIEGPGLSHPSYLLGTQHDYDGAVFLKEHPKVLECMEQTTSIIVESPPDSGGSGLDPAQMYFGGDSTLKLLLAPAQYDSIMDFVRKKAPGNEDLLQRLPKMKPQIVWLLMLELLSDSSASALTMDQYVKQLAVEKGLTVQSLETNSERTSPITGSAQYQHSLTAILQSIRKDHLGQPSNNAIATKEYHDLDINYALALKPSVDLGGVEARNALWVQRLQPMLQAQSCFIAVGCDHLRATFGLIVRLRGLNYKVTPVII